MAERFIHYSAKPIAGVRDTFQQGRRAEQGDKPNGLWFSVDGSDDGWRQWCESESFQLDRLASQTEIVFRPDAKILRLGSAADIDIFHAEYRIIPEWARDMSFARYGIDWPKVAERYEAIIIAPYVWERRLSDHCFWYYGWDCASGAVWCSRAVEALKTLEVEAV